MKKTLIFHIYYTFKKILIKKNRYSCVYVILISRIFSETEGPLDFNEILVNGSVINVVSMDNISFWRKSLFKKLSAFKAIYFVCNSEENEILIFHIYCML